MAVLSRENADAGLTMHIPDTADELIWGGVKQPRKRGPEWFAPMPTKPIGVFDSPITLGAVSMMSLVGIALGLGVSANIVVSPGLHQTALFVHLACLAIGFGAVLVADYGLLLWTLGRSTLQEAVHSAERLHVPIWVGLSGLLLSGFLLNPVLSSPLTQVKVAAVIILTLNGFQAMAMGRKMRELGSRPLPMSLMIRGGMTASLSQLCWWVATGVGFWNAQN